MNLRAMNVPTTPNPLPTPSQKWSEVFMELVYLTNVTNKLRKNPNKGAYDTDGIYATFERAVGVIAVPNRHQFAGARASTPLASAPA